MMDFFPGGEQKEIDPILVSPLATTSHLPVQLTEQTMRKGVGTGAQEAKHREWVVNSVLEVLSASKNRWYVAYVLQVHPGEYDSQMLTVRFWDEHNEAKQKNIARGDASLANCGKYTVGQLPPGFHSQASQSRPGSNAYLDTATGMKYSSPEIAWNVHFQRLRDGPPMLTAEVVEEAEAPVPLRNPVAIAAGITEDVCPMPKPKPRTASSAPETAQERYKREKAEWASGVVDQEEKRKEAAKVQPSKIDAKAQRSTNQPTRSCASAYSPSAAVADAPKSMRHTHAGHLPPRSCATFNPSHLDEMPEMHKPMSQSAGPSARQQKSAPAYAAAAASAGY